MSVGLEISVVGTLLIFGPGALLPVGTTSEQGQAVLSMWRDILIWGLR